MLALGGCALPAPYQTYSPGVAAAPAPPPNALTVYGATTTTPDNEMDFTGQELTTPVPADVAAKPALPTPTTNQRVAICYSRLWNSADAVRNAAVQACGANSAPHIVSQGADLDACPLMTPTHAVFSCTP